MGLGPIDTILNIGEKLIDKLIPDPKQKADAILKLKELEQAGDLTVIAGQVEINKIEAGNRSLFVSGWRPSIGWICSGALAIQYIIGPLLALVSTIFGHPVIIPPLDTALLTTLLVGMLGLGGLRTVEKLNSVAAQ